MLDIGVDLKRTSSMYAFCAQKPSHSIPACTRRLPRARSQPTKPIDFYKRTNEGTESRKCSILPTDLIQKYQILLLLVRHDNQILVLNLSILLSKKQKKVSDDLQWLSKDILG